MRKLSEQVAVEKGGHGEALEALAAQHDDELAQAGRVPPIDPSNSLTRIGVGTAKTLRAAGSTPAMQDVTRALRLEQQPQEVPRVGDDPALGLAGGGHVVQS